MADMYSPAPPAQLDRPHRPLNEAEDAELRRLNYMSKAGPLSEWSRGRMRNLRSRDRRQVIRAPKEFKAGAKPPSRGFWSRLLG